MTDKEFVKQHNENYRKAHRKLTIFDKYFNKFKIKFNLLFSSFQTVQIISQSFSYQLEKDLMELLQKKLGFVETVEYGWVRGFTRVVIDKEGVYIGHKINKITNKSMIKMTKVSNPLRTINDWINYYDNI